MLGLPRAARGAWVAAACLALLGFAAGTDNAVAGRPHLISLYRESIPVKRKGKVVSYKSSYSGMITVGSPQPQEFRVVFDTGSGYVIVPALQCTSASCLRHRRYNAKISETARPINADGTPLGNKKVGDTVTIGFGTGKVTGELVTENVCFGLRASAATPDGASGNLRRNAVAASGAESVCTEVNTVMATDMSKNPFSQFSFDGVVGLGLKSLSLSENFSFFDRLANSGHLATPHFGWFSGDENEEGSENSELAIGGHNPARLAGPLVWSSVILPELGFWQVEIVAVYVGDDKLDICDSGDCRGVVDTGTSHLGVPAPHFAQVEGLLKTAAGDAQDCRDVGGPTLKFGLRGGKYLTLRHESYMRRLPLSEAVHLRRRTVSNEPASAETAAAAADRAAEAEASASTASSPPASSCRPKITPVNMAAPLGPNLFILGEPLLRSYYTVFEWSPEPRVGFGPVARGLEEDLLGSRQGGVVPTEVGDIHLLQRGPAGVQQQSPQ